MKISNRLVFYFYLMTVCFLIIYTLTSIEKCEAYWMHDASILISKRNLFANTSYLFLLPMLIIIAQSPYKIPIPTKLFLIHYFIALTSILLLLFAINKPCENLNNGHYMFISSTKIIGYYFFKLVSSILIGVILIQFIILKSYTAKTGQA